MTDEEFKHLREGDIVRARASGLGYTVCANYGRRVTAIRTIDMTNPEEFDLVRKSAQDGPLDLPNASTPSA